MSAYKPAYDFAGNATAAATRQEQRPHAMGLALFASRKASDARQGKGEERARFVARLTHLRLQDMGISRIDALDACRKLQVLYLNSNVLTCMQGLQHPRLRSLVQLDLQDNDIAVMEGLGALTGLRRLSVARNCIAFVAGLEGCPRLEQLDVSGQRLASAAVEVEFDGATVGALAQSLTSLNCSQNGLTHVEHLACLDALRTLDISGNAVASLEAFADLLSPVSARTGRPRALRSLDCTRNPCLEGGSNNHRARDRLVMMAPVLRSLNGKDIDPRQRDFLMRFEARKAVPKKKKRGPPANMDGQGVLVEASNARQAGLAGVVGGSGRPLAFESRDVGGPSLGYAPPGVVSRSRGSKISGHAATTGAVAHFR